MQRQIHNASFEVISAGTVLAVALIVIPVLVPLSAAHAQFLEWDGDCGNNIWDSVCGNPVPSVTNWTPNEIPGNGDSVQIIGTVVYISNLFANCSGISCYSGLNITNGGQLYCGGGGNISNLSLNNASVRTAGVLEITNNSTTNGGVFYGPGTFYHHDGTMIGLSMVIENNPAATFFNGDEVMVSSMQIDPGATMRNHGAVTLVPHQQVNGGGINASSGGTGLFINEGHLVTQHDGTAHSQFIIGCVLENNGGLLKVEGQPNLLGTVINNFATFNGGDITVDENGVLRFWSGTHEFNAPFSITGAGSVFLSLSTSPGQGWLVGSTLDVDLSSTTGFMLDTGRLALENGTLHNEGNVLWKGTTIMQQGCEPGETCASKFHNEGLVTFDPGGPFSAARLDARFVNDETVRHVQGNLIFDDDARFENNSLTSEYELRSGNITRAAPQYLGEFVNSFVATLKKPELTETTDSLITAVFRNEQGNVEVNSSILTFGMGCLRLEGGTFTVNDPKEGGAEIVLTGDTHLATEFTTRFVGTGACRLLGGTLRIVDGATVETDMSSPDRAFILDTNGRLGGPGLFHNLGFMTIKGGTIGVANAAGGFDSLVVNHGTTFIHNGTATVKGTFINGFGGTASNINGHLFIDNGTVMNQGTWLFDEGTMSVSGSGVFVNLAGESAPPGEDGGDQPPEGSNAGGVLRCDLQPSQTLTISCAFDNQGAVSVDGGNLIFGPIAQLQDGVLSGGTWLVGPEGSLALPGTLNTIGADASVHAHGLFTDLRTLQTNQGTLHASGQTICGSDNNCNNHNNRFTNEGTVSLTPPKGASPALSVDGEVNNSPLAYMDNQVVLSVAGGTEGESFIALECDALDNDGTLAPGGGDAPGAFSMIGDFNQSESGALEIDLAGETPGDEHDQLIVDGDVLLGGHLNVRVLPGYVPEGGEQFTIVTASNGTISGTFDHVDGPGQYSVSYAPASVILTLIAPSQPGDTNGDGSVDVDDLINVILGWGECPAPPTFCNADVDGNGAVDVDDLIIVILNWG